MKLRTTSGGLKDTIDGIATGGNIDDVGDEHRLALAQAFVALARLVNTSGSDVVLLADVADDAATLSLVSGKASEALAADVPWQNPHLAEIDKERQAAQAQADDAEADRIRELLKR